MTKNSVPFHLIVFKYLRTHMIIPWKLLYSSWGATLSSAFFVWWDFTCPQTLGDLPGAILLVGSPPSAVSEFPRAMGIPGPVSCFSKTNASIGDREPTVLDTWVDFPRGLSYHLKPFSNQVSRFCAKPQIFLLKLDCQMFTYLIAYSNK